jgi:hypothetical protein
MKTLLYRALILLVIAALVVPLSAGDSTAPQAPVCCLAKGEHHCLGQVPGGDGAPALSSVVAQCPYAPFALAAMHGPALDRPVSAWSLKVNAAETFLLSENCLSTVSSYVSAFFERGPPSFSFN